MPAGWLRALADPRLVPALRLMHGDLGRDWQRALREEDWANAGA
jgi:hypothetical protein